MSQESGTDNIGRGAQYQVVDLHDGRVRKIPLTLEESQATIRSWFAPDPAPAELLAIDFPQLADDATQHTSWLLETHPELAATFANPVFEDGGRYTQDKTPLLGNVMRERSVPEAKELIEGYIGLVIRHWRYGIADFIFKCAANNGVDPQDRVVMLDFGEITTSKETIAEHLAAQSWLESNSYRNRLSPPLKAYYAQRMATMLTHETLENVWGTALRHQPNAEEYATGPISIGQSLPTL